MQRIVKKTADTINAGRGLCRTDAVTALTAEAPGAVAELRRLGVRFDTEADGARGTGGTKGCNSGSW